MKNPKFRIIFHAMISTFVDDEGRSHNTGEVRILSTGFGNVPGPYEPGDCYVRAISARVDPRSLVMNLYKGELRGLGSKEQLSRPMTLNSIAKFIHSNKHLLGPRHGNSRCIGIALLDDFKRGSGNTGAESKPINFHTPIRNEG